MRRGAPGWRSAAALVVASVLAFAACSGDEGTAEAGPIDVYLKGAGATFPAPLYESWFASYAQEHAGKIKIDYNAIGSGGGERLFLDGAVDFGASDAAALTDEQIAGLARGVRFVPMTAGAIALVYNLPELRSELRLSREVYVDIFLGRIAKWNDPRLLAINPGATLPDREIRVVVRTDKSGTTYAFTKHLSAVSATWRDGPGYGKRVGWPGECMIAPGNFGNAALVARNPGTISYVQYSFAKELGLRCALLENQAGNYVAVGPDSGRETLAALPLPADLRAYAPDPGGAQSYPIVTLTWVLLYAKYPDPKAAAALRELFRWCLTTGQSRSSELGYIPLAQPVVEKALAAVDGIGN